MSCPCPSWDSCCVWVSRAGQKATGIRRVAARGAAEKAWERAAGFAKYMHPHLLKLASPAAALQTECSPQRTEKWEVNPLRLEEEPKVPTEFLLAGSFAKTPGLQNICSSVGEVKSWNFRHYFPQQREL